ncbi:MAG: hypothetical protein Q7J59_01045 [Elusimicrobiota bacterium]|nr:hypothetical protein [Elusimicrobiota bacterium]
MKKQQSDIKRDVINLAGMGFSRFSLSPIAGQIYALLYMSDGPVTLNDMVRELGISKGSASMNIRILEAWGAVRKLWVNSDRKDYYEANPDIMTIALKRFKEGMVKRLDELAPALEKAGDSDLKGGVAAKDAEFYRGRLAEIKKLMGGIRKAVEIIPESASDKKFRIISKIISVLK